MKLIFIYNANSGRFNAWLDSAHKIISPKTYACSLCDLTYSVFKENAEWLRFRESIINRHPNLELEFLHKDKFLEQYKSKWLPKYEFPLILKTSDQDMYDDGMGSSAGLEILISADEMNEMDTVEQLISKVELILNNK